MSNEAVVRYFGHGSMKFPTAWFDKSDIIFIEPPRYEKQLKTSLKQRPAFRANIVVSVSRPPVQQTMDEVFALFKKDLLSANKGCKVIGEGAFSFFDGRGGMEIAISYVSEGLPLTQLFALTQHQGAFITISVSCDTLRWSEMSGTLIDCVRSFEPAENFA